MTALIVVIAWGALSVPLAWAVACLMRRDGQEGGAPAGARVVRAGAVPAGRWSPSSLRAVPSEAIDQ